MDNGKSERARLSLDFLTSHLRSFSQAVELAPVVIGRGGNPSCFSCEGSEKMDPRHKPRG